MNAPFSIYLTGIAPGLKELIALLRQRFDYVSVLSTDSVGFSVSISQRAKSCLPQHHCHGARHRRAGIPGSAVCRVRLHRL